jgi:hypothetical protein
MTVGVIAMSLFLAELGPITTIFANWLVPLALLIVVLDERHRDKDGLVIS